jgi:hypothetical protein
MAPGASGRTVVTEVLGEGFRVAQAQSIEGTHINALAQARLVAD